MYAEASFSGVFDQVAPSAIQQADCDSVSLVMNSQFFFNLSAILMEPPNTTAPSLESPNTTAAARIGQFGQRIAELLAEGKPEERRAAVLLSQIADFTAGLATQVQGKRGDGG